MADFNIAWHSFEDFSCGIWPRVNNVLLDPVQSTGVVTRLMWCSPRGSCLASFLASKISQLPCPRLVLEKLPREHHCCLLPMPSKPMVDVRWLLGGFSLCCLPLQRCHVHTTYYRLPSMHSLCVGCSSVTSPHWIQSLRPHTMTFCINWKSRMFAGFRLNRPTWHFWAPENLAEEAQCKFAR